MGFGAARVRRLFLSEGLVLAAIGSIVGLAGALAYADLIMFGLRTWWVDAVGTRLLTLHASTKSLALGGAGGILAAVAGIAWTLRSVQPMTPRSLLTGTELDASAPPGRTRRALLVGMGSALAALVLLIGAWSDWLSQVAGFFGAGTLLLLASLSYLWSRLAGRKRELLAGTGSWAVSRLGFRNATYRPGRSLLCVALIAFATFVIVAVDAFRRDDRETSLDPKSGTGGFSLLAESLLPLLWDPNTAEGREALGIEGDESLADLRFSPLRVRPGEDASCLNLYRPQNPRILAPTQELVESGRFAFAGTLAESQQEKDNPWLLLDTEQKDDAIPVIGDANSMTYVLHLKLGEDLLLERGGEEPLRLRLVGMLKDSVFQGELLMSERNFLRVFPNQEGFRFFLLESPPDETESVTETLERRLADFGFDVVGTADRLAGFHRVENTYLSTFQTLGGLGLVLGTLGLGAVLLRNVLERRRELALLRAVGYDSRDLSLMVLSENAVMLFWGLATGTICALVAITPALVSRGGAFSLPSLSLLLLAVLASGVFASLLAVAASVRSPLLDALRAE
jgi:ABC-type antimicrobial peptide transport system permease subunit